MLDTKKIKTEWDLSVFYKNDKDPKIEKDKKEVEKKVNAFVNKWEKRADWLKDPKVLKKALDDYSQILETAVENPVSYYFFLRSNIESGSEDVKRGVSSINNFANKNDVKLQFFILKLSKIGKKQQSIFLSTPELASYNYFLKRLFVEGKYLLSAEIEKVLSLKSNVSSTNWQKMLSDFVNETTVSLNFPDKKRGDYTVSKLLGLYEDSNREVRKTAYNGVQEILCKNHHIAERELNSLIENKGIDDELRGFSRPDEFRLVSECVEPATVDALRGSVRNSYSLAVKYYDLKRRLLGLKKLQPYDTSAPIISNVKDYSFNESVKIVYKTLHSIDPEFASYFEETLYKGYIDVFPKKGKRGGAFCVSSNRVSPFFILLNYTKKLDDVLTIAHEMGHCINDYCMRVQNPLYFTTPLATAEVASTFFEGFVIEELSKGVDDETKLVLLLQKLRDSIGSIHTQIMFYEFEWELHTQHKKHAYLTGKEIDELFVKHRKKLFGDVVENISGKDWVRVPHFRYFFYVYSYASGLLISKALQAKVKQDPKFIKQVKQFLSAGSSDSPKNLFLKMGIDITKPEFWDTGLLEIKNDLNEAEKLAKKLGKI